jgi:hypothetical protein
MTTLTGVAHQPISTRNEAILSKTIKLFPQPSFLQIACLKGPPPLVQEEESNWIADVKEVWKEQNAKIVCTVTNILIELANLCAEYAVDVPSYRLMSRMDYDSVASSQGSEQKMNPAWMECLASAGRKQPWQLWPCRFFGQAVEIQVYCILKKKGESLSLRLYFSSGGEESWGCTLLQGSQVCHSEGKHFYLHPTKHRLEPLWRRKDFPQLVHLCVRPQKVAKHLSDLKAIRFHMLEVENPTCLSKAERLAIAALYEENAPLHPNLFARAKTNTKA